MEKHNSPIAIENGAQETVLAFLDALNEEDFRTARSLVHEDLAFIGVMGSRHGAEAYFQDMERMRFKYAVKKIFVDEEDVCLFYDIDMAGKAVFCCGWYHLEGGRIKSFRVVFDPRPILETPGKPSGG